VPPENAAVGVSVATCVGASYVTVAPTGAGAPAAVSVNVLAAIVAGSMAPEKVTVCAVVCATPVAPSAGVRPTPSRGCPVG
jgi:hypothetical protein